MGCNRTITWGAVDGPGTAFPSGGGIDVLQFCCPLGEGNLFGAVSNECIVDAARSFGSGR